MRARRHRRTGGPIWATVVVVAVLGAACSGDDGAASDGAAGPGDADAPPSTDAVHEGTRTIASSASGTLVLETTSTRADLVSGGDVLLTLSGPDAADAELTVDGDRVDDLEDAGDARRVLVEGLAEGDHEVEARAGDEVTRLVVTNHPSSGPVFSGPHLEPWVCTTEQHGLDAAEGPDCDAPARVSWSYRTTDGEVVDLEDPTARPDDLDTVEIDGVEVPFIVREERLVIDRGVAYVWVLDADPDPEGSWAGGAWNERLVYKFGGGCGTQYTQGGLIGAGLDVGLLERGYAIATNTLNTFQTACNAVLSAEAALMTREHFVERYGVPRFTIGDGGSGGAIQQLQLAYNYPGLLDAVSPSVPFPDAISIAGGVTDCGLLLEYYDGAGSALTEEQRVAINGHATTGTCEMWADLFLSGVDPTEGCTLPEDQVYDPESNPEGARCTLQDMNVNALGHDPETGFARRPLDNIGIQYGLEALRDGVIDIDEFLDLNEAIGGYDIDGNIVAERAEMSEEIAAIAHASGGVTGAILDIPIVLRDVYTDDDGDIHTRFHAFSIRERLRSNGDDADNLLLWTTPVGAGGLVANLTGAIGDSAAVVGLLDEWLTAAADADGESPSERLAAGRPDAATNRCALEDGTLVEGGWEIYDEPGPCADAYPVAGDPRTAAGAAIAGDVLKCSLVPVDAKLDADPDAYGGPLTDEQRTRLTATFPDGVCDWEAPGVGSEPGEAGEHVTWRSYRDA